MANEVYRETLAELAREHRAGYCDLETVLHEAYLAGIRAHEEMIKFEEPTIYRLATQEDEPMPRRSWSSVKGYYATAANARRAKVHAFQGETLKVQAGRVQWEDV